LVVREARIVKHFGVRVVGVVKAVGIVKAVGVVRVVRVAVSLKELSL
jgi:hypothetical protein